ncbi:hypothetical protein [uncultured Methanobrevibacter sp.]|uniref:hypothetical protein n=1 Tax=uncultured Methanobrevibacter sp. TaxID=253161 RepID=UPI0025D84A1B|nr:hypothetical protein [uncultured Methanobrevibacter sp.]
MIDNAEDLAKKAQDNKAGLKRQFVNIPIGDEEYGFRISGIGAKSVKLEKFVKYDDIMEAVESGNDFGLEAMIKQIIEDYEEEDEEE